MFRNKLGLCNKSLRARINVAHVEFFRGLARPAQGCSVTATNRNRECRMQNMFSVLRDLHVSECKRPHSRTYNVCLWKLGERNKVCTSKQFRFVASTETFIGNQALV